MRWQEVDDNILFDSKFVFHKSFINSYKGMDIVNLRRKLKKYYNHSMQDIIIKYIKSKN
jgi:hypothetical protein